MSDSAAATAASPADLVTAAVGRFQQQVFEELSSRGGHNMENSLATVQGIGEAEDGLSYWQLSFLTLQAVFQTVIICFIGYMAARNQWLHRVAQKEVSNLNVMVFTPCLIFSKLASSLSLSALLDIAIIPVLFVVTTVVSLMAARVASRVLRLTKPEGNFVTAMAVFGNSNSLPVSLTVSLAYTLPMLKWPDIPNDNADDVASRGILYLLIFQQLGQIVRWSWGYNTLLARPPDKEPEADPLLTGDDEQRWPAETPASLAGAEDPNGDGQLTATHTRANSEADDDDDDDDASAEGDTRATSVADDSTIVASNSRRALSHAKRYWLAFLSFMNPPLWSMLAAIIVASTPALKYELYEKNGFVANTVGSAIIQVGKIAIPLILMVLGSNLHPDPSLAPKSPNHKKMVFASLLCRMLIPALVLLPIIALSVKYINISILDDPIFLLVAFILTVSPPAIQLSQICHINGVFEQEMSSVLFWGYVILTLPSTIAIVVTSLEVLDWAGVTRN